jgi:hypothetical protein
LRSVKGLVSYTLVRSNVVDGHWPCPTPFQRRGELLSALFML